MATVPSFSAKAGASAQIMCTMSRERIKIKSFTEMAAAFSPCAGA